MSIKVMSWVWEHGPKDPTERLVLLALADHADDRGRAFPSMIGIGEKACVTERGARGIIRRLEAAGWVETQVGGGRGGKSNYTIIMRTNPEQETGNEKPGIENTEPETRKLATVNPERGDTKPGTRVPPNRQGTIKEPSEERRVREILGSVLSEEAADDFISHRKHKRSKLTPRAAALIVGDLTGHHDPDAVVRESVKNGWTGVFPDRVKNRGQPNAPTPSQVSDDIWKAVAEGTPQ